MSASEIEITPYADAPWAPRLEGAQFAYRVTMHGNEVMTGATRGDRDAVLKAATRFVERIKRERKGQAEAFRNFKIRA
jgi:hypothetical protein